MGFCGIFECGKNTLDIDKSWHAIHYTLTGKVWSRTSDPLSWMMMGKNPQEKEHQLDLGEIKDINIALEAVTDEVLREKFSLYDLFAKDIYPYHNEQIKEQVEALQKLGQFFQPFLDDTKKYMVDFNQNKKREILTKMNIGVTEDEEFEYILEYTRMIKDFFKEAELKNKSINFKIKEEVD